VASLRSEWLGEERMVALSRWRLSLMPWLCASLFVFPCASAPLCLSCPVAQFGDCPLLFATLRSHVGVVEELVKAGADVTLRSQVGPRAHIAASLRAQYGTQHQWRDARPCIPCVLRTAGVS
jgi:hypothetical protein